MNKLVRVRLLDCGGYNFMAGVELPAFVDGKINEHGTLVLIKSRDLELIGCKMGYINGAGAGDVYCWPFVIGESCEIVND